MRNSYVKPVLWLAVVAFLLGHLFFLARSLEDIDSVNFALGVRSYDIGSHQPHPPGYPVYVALGKLGTRVAGILPMADGSVAPVPEARGLALWGAVLGALAGLAFYGYFRHLEPEHECALAAVVITLSNPLMWMTASRPLSDVPGLAVSALAQALLVVAYRRQRETANARAAGRVVTGEDLARSGRLIVAAALVAGLAVGVRSQTALLTLPLLVIVLIDRSGQDAVGAWVGSLATFTMGVLVWGVPMVIATGGVGAYLDALSSQAGEDFSGVEMLATGFSVRELAFSVIDTFVLPWADVRLAAVVLVAAGIGAAVLLVRNRAALVLVGVATAPYVIFHLLFQETVTTRYALPVVPAVAFLAARGLAAVGRAALTAGAVGIAAAGLVVAVPALASYARDGSPLAQLTADLGTARAKEASVAGMHFAFTRALRGEDLRVPLLPSPVKHEWLPLVEYWRTGGDQPVWFLASPLRTDLALVDPASRRVRGRYRWPFDTRALLGGVRPSDVDWVEIRQPGWFAGSGWDLTPETAGVTRLDGKGPSVDPVTAWVRRRPEAATLLVGGRNLGAQGSPPVRFTVSVDGQPTVERSVDPLPGFFVLFHDLPAGALLGEGPFAQVTIAAEAADGSRSRVEASIEQFDLQSAGRALLAFDEGWHEAEYEPATGRHWRWTSQRSMLRVHPVVGDTTLTMEAESPLRYFDAAPTVRLLACGREVERLQPTRDLAWTVRVTKATLVACSGQITIETDRTFVPDERDHNGDRRRLGLRVFGVRTGSGTSLLR